MRITLRTNEPTEKFAVAITNPQNSLYLVADGNDLVSELLKRLENGYGNNHPNHKEIMTQIALINFFIQHSTGRPRFTVLWNDHWNVTFFTFIDLFKRDDAIISDREGTITYRVSELVLSDWTAGDVPQMQAGGEVFKTKSGEIILEYETWIS